LLLLLGKHEKITFEPLFIDRAREISGDNQRQNQRGITKMTNYTKVKSDIRHYNAGGQLHRTDGPAIVWPCGSKEWYINGQLHREDGPAVELNTDTKEWWIHGQKHREDGPAVEGSMQDEWWVNGKLICTTNNVYNRRALFSALEPKRFGVAQ
jgi:hypothetical protein